MRGEPPVQTNVQDNFLSFSLQHPQCLATEKTFQTCMLRVLVNQTWFALMIHFVLVTLAVVSDFAPLKVSDMECDLRQTGFVLCSSSNNINFFLCCILHQSTRWTSMVLVGKVDLGGHPNPSIETKMSKIYWYCKNVTRA